MFESGKEPLHHLVLAALDLACGVVIYRCKPEHFIKNTWVPDID